MNQAVSCGNSGFKIMYLAAAIWHRLSTNRPYCLSFPTNLQAAPTPSSRANVLHGQIVRTSVLRRARRAYVDLKIVSFFEQKSPATAQCRLRDWYGFGANASGHLLDELICLLYTGYPGIPPGPDRPQASVKGVRAVTMLS